MLESFKKVCSDLWRADGTPHLSEPWSVCLSIKKFYSKKRVRGCPMDEEADQLISEWGPASDKEFTWAFIRQLAPPRQPDRDIEIWQLSYDMRFPMSPQLARLKAGHKGFSTLQEVEGAGPFVCEAFGPFWDFVSDSKVGKQLSKVQPSRVIVTYENAE